MKHLLMDPAFPDLVAEWAAERSPADSGSENRECANDNRGHAKGDLADPLLTALARLEIAATRLW